MDGKEFARGPQAQWLPWPGRHVVQLVDAGGKVADEIKFEVRGAGVREASARGARLRHGDLSQPRHATTYTAAPHLPCFTQPPCIPPMKTTAASLKPWLCCGRLLCMLAAAAMAAPARGWTAAPDAAHPSPPTVPYGCVPPYSARVLDTTGTLNTAQVAALNEQILALEADTRAAVVVFMLPTTGEEAIEEYATRVFEKWKLGDTARDDGILILVALKTGACASRSARAWKAACPTCWRAASSTSR
jgi:hypothetical protein